MKNIIYLSTLLLSPFVFSQNSNTVQIQPSKISKANEDKNVEETNRIIAENKKQLSFYKEKISKNIDFINASILSDPKYNKLYDKFFNEIIPEAKRALGSSDYEDIRGSFLTTEKIMEDFKNDAKWFH